MAGVQRRLQQAICAEVYAGAQQVCADRGPGLAGVDMRVARGADVPARMWVAVVRPGEVLGGGRSSGGGDPGRD